MMRQKRRTISESCWPDTPEFVTEAEKLIANVPKLLMGYVWNGYDLLVEQVSGQIDFSERPEDVERDLTERLEIRIRRSMTGYEPFEIRHGVAERESRQPAPAQPPEYDLAFALRTNERVMWPIEAKFLPSAGQIAEYVKAVKERFLTCYYAPFSREGSMIGYLAVEGTELACASIAVSLDCEMTQNPEFPNRAHKISSHQRVVPKGKPYPPDFRCHHMIMQLNSAKKA